MSPESATAADVTVIGGGLAGLAASIHLARAGLRVVCLEPQTGPRQPVGESLDWSTPALLQELGLSMRALIASGYATYKQGVTLRPWEGAEQKYYPGAWLGRAPFHVELRTLHVDRAYLDQRLVAIAGECGVAILNDRAVAVERRGRRIQCVHTAGGASLASPWFIDASGFACSLLAREFGSPEVAYGEKRVATWAYFPSDSAAEGTTIYTHSGRQLEWVWEIPITAGVLSVGAVTTAEHMKQSRKTGASVDEIYGRQLLRFERLSRLLESGWLTPPRAVSFACRTYRDVAGPNWLIAGEAASLVDPITSNGATAALRHAREASAIIAAARHQREIPARSAALYKRRVNGLAGFFNSGIEKLVYDWPVREWIGLPRAARLYTAGAWLTNALYTRLEPRGALSTALFGFWLGCLRTGATALHALATWWAPPPLEDRI